MFTEDGLNKYIKGVNSLGINPEVIGKFTKELQSNWSKKQQEAAKFETPRSVGASRVGNINTVNSEEPNQYAKAAVSVLEGVTGYMKKNKKPEVVPVQPVQPQVGVSGYLVSGPPSYIDPWQERLAKRRAQGGGNY